jgi:hypothetical protein
VLREYLNYALTFHLNVSLPDHIDDIWTGDMRRYCRSAWEQVETDGRIKFSEFVSVWPNFLFSKLLFWKR